MAENQNRTVVGKGGGRSLNSEENGKTLGKGDDKWQKRIKNDGE